jgi:hypothetical protein
LPNAAKPELLVMLGYELQKVEQAITLQMTYGHAEDDENGPTSETPILYLLADEARQLARDLLDIADKIAPVEEPPRLQ